MTATGDVGAYYDVLTPVLRQLWGENLHIGLWPDESDDVAAAGDRLTDLLLSELLLRPEQRLLDIGCGIGGPALRLARTTGASVSGVTISTTQVALATARAEAAGLERRATFHLADATHLPFADHSLDAAWAIESLLHISDTHAAVAETRRVLRPGSPLVISDMILRGEDPSRHEHSSVKPLTTLLALLTDRGFTVEKVQDLDEHLDQSLRRLEADLTRQHDVLRAAHGDDAVDALSRILRKTIPGIGTVFGYVVVTARTVPTCQGDHDE
jgi:cyclopropane fatty-acyl-phospholipid synthase-like methyltransferase